MKRRRPAWARKLLAGAVLAIAIAGCGGGGTKKPVQHHSSSTTHKKHSSTPGY